MTFETPISSDVRVVLVDDDDDTRANLRDILECDGYRVEEAASAEALFALEAWEKATVILLDRKLPDGTPETLLPRIKRRAPEVSVVIVTGYADLDGAISALRLGAGDYIVKPINPDALRAVVKREIAHRNAERRALQAERLAAIGETMTALVHESRNALQRSYASLEILALEVQDRPTALDLVHRTQRAQTQLRDLFEEVRQWAAPLNLTCERTNLVSVWREAWRHAAQVHPEKKLELFEEIDCDTVCRIDAAKIGQVFRNVFENAFDAAPAGSAVRVKCRSVRGTDDDDVLVSVLDAGEGIPSDRIAHVFEPFFTTKAKGTGLGLSLARRIVEAHHGRMEASSPGGARFEIVVPRGCAP